jgi:hypothetical protein
MTAKRSSPTPPPDPKRTPAQHNPAPPGASALPTHHPIFGSDAGWVDLVPLDLRIGPAAPEGEDWGAGPINNSDTDEADFLPALETEHQR